MLERTFHLVVPEQWNKRPVAEWAPRSLALEGFIHASLAPQLRGTLAAHYADESRLYLLELCPLRTADAMRLEPSRDGALFPHLHRALEPDDILRHWKLRARGRSWNLPRFAEKPESDNPSGHPGPPR